MKFKFKVGDLCRIVKSYSTDDVGTIVEIEFVDHIPYDGTPGGYHPYRIKKRRTVREWFGDHNLRLATDAEKMAYRLLGNK